MGPGSLNPPGSSTASVYSTIDIPATVYNDATAHAILYYQMFIQDGIYELILAKLLGCHHKL